MKKFVLLSHQPSRRLRLILLITYDFSYFLKFYFTSILYRKLNQFLGFEVFVEFLQHYFYRKEKSPIKIKKQKYERRNKQNIFSST
jgi:hypothetical protein